MMRAGGWGKLARASALALVLGVTANAALGQDELEQKNRELEATRERIEAVNTELAAQRAEQAEATKALRRLEVRIGRAESALDESRQRLAASNRRIAKLKRQRDDAAQRLAKHRKRLARQLRAAQAAGDSGALRMLLQQDSPARAQRMAVYYEYFNEARAARIRAASRALAELRRLQESLSAEHTELAKLKAQRRERLTALQGDRERRAALVEQRRRAISAKGEALERLKADEAQLTTLVDKLRQRLADIPTDTAAQPFSKAKGALRWPLQGPLLARYGTQRRSGVRWSGLLIGADAGDPVHAVANGRVVFSDWLRGLGLLLIVDHGNGYMTLYGRNQSLYKDVGDWVEPGETIAAVGSSGGRERSGLYFEIRTSGKPVSPLAWLGDRVSN